MVFYHKMIVAVCTEDSPPEGLKRERERGDDMLHYQTFRNKIRFVGTARLVKECCACNFIQFSESQMNVVCATLFTHNF